jgi:hypothetical protein
MLWSHTILQNPIRGHVQVNFRWASEKANGKIWSAPFSLFYYHITVFSDWLSWQRSIHMRKFTCTWHYKEYKTWDEESNPNGQDKLTHKTHMIKEQIKDGYMNGQYKVKHMTDMGSSFNKTDKMYNHKLFKINWCDTLRLLSNSVTSDNSN